MYYLLSVVMNSDQNQLEEEKMNLAYSSMSQFITEGRQDRSLRRNWRQELKQRPWRGTVYWIDLPGLTNLVYFIYYLRQLTLGQDHLQ